MKTLRIASVLLFSVVAFADGPAQDEVAKLKEQLHSAHFQTMSAQFQVLQQQEANLRQQWQSEITQACLDKKIPSDKCEFDSATNSVTEEKPQPKK